MRRVCSLPPQGAFAPWTLPELSLQNQGALIFPTERAPEKRSRMGAHSLNVLVQSAILERDREGGGHAPL
jgi:hypothetical protein